MPARQLQLAMPRATSAYGQEWRRCPPRDRDNRGQRHTLNGHTDNGCMIYSTQASERASTLQSLSARTQPQNQTRKSHNRSQAARQPGRQLDGHLSNANANSGGERPSDQQAAAPTPFRPSPSAAHTDTGFPSDPAAATDTGVWQAAGRTQNITFPVLVTLQRSPAAAKAAAIECSAAQISTKSSIQQKSSSK